MDDIIGLMILSNGHTAPVQHMTLDRVKLIVLLFKTRCIARLTFNLDDVCVNVLQLLCALMYPTEMLVVIFFIGLVSHGKS